MNQQATNASESDDEIIMLSSALGTTNDEEIVVGMELDVETEPLQATGGLTQMETMSNGLQRGSRMTPLKQKTTNVPQGSPPSKLSKDEDDSEDGQHCPICFEVWTDSGGHRLSSLKCGHLFGQSCIEKWLKGQGGKCPQCNAKAKKADVRVIYAKAIKTIDRSEMDRIENELEKERKERKKAEMEAAEARMQRTMAVSECRRLEQQVEQHKQQMKALRTIQPAMQCSQSGAMNTLQPLSQDRGQYVLEKTIKICDTGTCRVLAYCDSMATLVVSQRSVSSLFPGYGVRKINAIDFKTTQYAAVHMDIIRDLAFRPSTGDSIMLSGGLDKKAMLTSLISNSVVQKYTCTAPVWSCTWNSDNDQCFYAGQANGTVAMFDIRNTSETIALLNQGGAKSPVASLQYIPADSQTEFRPGGLLVGQLNKISFFEAKAAGNNYQVHCLPLNGLLTALSFEPVSRQGLATFRPTSQKPYVQHQMFSMTKAYGTTPNQNTCVCSCEVKKSFRGGNSMKMLSRSTVHQHPSEDGRLLIAAGNEANSCVDIWDTQDTQVKHRLLEVSGPTLDVCPFTFNQKHRLATLTDRNLRLYKWQANN